VSVTAISEQVKIARVIWRLLREKKAKPSPLQRFSCFASEK